MDKYWVARDNMERVGRKDHAVEQMSISLALGFP
jgi:hypothetical protein